MNNSYYILGDSDNSRRPIIHTGDNSDLIRIANEVDEKNKTKDKEDGNKIQNSPLIMPPSQDLFFINKKSNYDELKKYFKKEFPKHEKIFEKLTWDANNNVATGSSTYIAIATDMYHKKYMPEYRLARQVDFETDLQKFKGFYVDSGLALRSTDGTNSKQAKSLYEQLQERNKKIKFPVWIDLRGLSLDSNLDIKLTDESTYKTADCLNWTSGTYYSAKDDFGLPSSEDKTSGRQIWTPDTKKGLLRCHLNWVSGLYSNEEGFANSNSNGRVVLAKISRRHCLK